MTISAFTVARARQHAIADHLQRPAGWPESVGWLVALGPTRGAERLRETGVLGFESDVQRGGAIRAGLVDARPRSDEALRHLHAAAAVPPLRGRHVIAAQVEFESILLRRFMIF